jgi:O-antigen/teichoic acid export membrane protein
VIAHALVAVYCLWYWAKIVSKEKQKHSLLSPENPAPSSINLQMMTTMALPLFLASSTRLILDWTDTLMLGMFRTEDEVGIYNTALKIAMLTGLPLLAINSIAAPKFSALYHKGEFTEFKRYVQLATQLNFFATIPILILLTVLPNFVLGLFGEEFITGRNTLWVLLLGQLVNTFSGSVGYILQMTNRQKIFQRFILGAAVINVILNYWLIPIMGISGAAIATAISMAFWNLGCVLYIYHKMKVVTYFRPSITSLLRLFKKLGKPDA